MFPLTYGSILQQKYFYEEKKNNRKFQINYKFFIAKVLLSMDRNLFNSVFGGAGAILRGGLLDASFESTNNTKKVHTTRNLKFFIFTALERPRRLNCNNKTVSIDVMYLHFHHLIVDFFYSRMESVTSV